MNPESLMMTHGYEPEWSEGSVKCPVFQTSTFVFKSAEEGKAFFEVAYGLRDKAPAEKLGLIYSRLNNPNLQILEERLCLWDKAESAAVFDSGMAAISSVMLEFLRPGDIVLHSNPLYGGTDHFIREFLAEYGIESFDFMPDNTEEEIIAMVEEAGLSERVAMVYVETPANPTNTLIDLRMTRNLADRLGTAEKRPILVADNTYMGPVWQNPIEFGIDIVLYSATKYLGGHSDLIAGAVLGSEELIQRVKGARTFMGNMIDPHTAWLLTRSLETLKIRMDRQAENAKVVARFLNEHSKIERVFYPSLLDKDSDKYRLYKEQCKAPGAMISFDVKGGEKEAFSVLNSLNLIHLAVSLGSTESLAQHPATMTHAGVDQDLKNIMGIGPSLIRLSVGVEHPDDIIADLSQALEQMTVAEPVLM